MKIGRRDFIFQMALVAGWLFRPRLAFPSFEDAVILPGRDSGGAIGVKSIDFFLKEKVDYDINFLWFKKAAEGSLQFMPEGDGFKAILKAETKGLVGFFTSYRKHLYVSHFKYIPDRNKFRTSMFERHVIIKDTEEKTITTLDYKSRTVRWKEYRGGKLVDEPSEAIPEGVEYEDILSAFYNFRLGAYGPIKRGRAFKVRTIPEKGKSTIDVNIPAMEEAAKSKWLFGRNFDEGLLLVKVKVPREIFKSKTGEVSILIDDRIIPLQGIVQDYIGFGDVKGVLKA